MAKQRVVNTHFWNDDFILDLKADEKLLFLYILTNPQTDLCGAYQIAMKRITFDTGLTAARVRTILDKFEAAEKVCYRDGWMLVKNFAKHQVKNPKVTAGIERSLNGCPDWVKQTLSKGFDSLSKRVTLEPELKPELELKPSEEKRVAPAKNQNHAEFILALRNNPDYSHIEIDIELARAEAWAKSHGRAFNRRFVTNWLDRIEKPLTLPTGRTSDLPTLEEKLKADAEYRAKTVLTPPPTKQGVTNAK